MGSAGGRLAVLFKHRVSFICPHVLATSRQDLWEESGGCLGEGLADSESVTLSPRQDAEMCQELEKPS